MISLRGAKHLCMAGFHGNRSFLHRRTVYMPTVNKNYDIPSHTHAACKHTRTHRHTSELLQHYCMIIMLIIPANIQAQAVLFIWIFLIFTVMRLIHPGYTYVCSITWCSLIEWMYLYNNINIFLFCDHVLWYSHDFTAHNSIVVLLYIM